MKTSGITSLDTLSGGCSPKRLPAIRRKHRVKQASRILLYAAALAIVSREVGCNVKELKELLREYSRVKYETNSVVNH